MASPTTDRRLGLAGNTAYKVPATTVALVNLTLSGEQTVNGVAVKAANSAGVPDRVLASAQTDATQNGLWDVSTAAWSRSIDANGNYDLVQGTQVAITQGTSANSIWQLLTSGLITIGTTAMSWAQSLSSAFLTTLALSTGATLVGWIQAGTSAVLRTVSSKLRDTVSPEDFGAVADDTTDCLAAFQACYTYCVSVNKAMSPLGGTYKLSGTWTVSDSNFRFIPKGATTLHFTNAGRALVIDGGSVSGNIWDVVFGGDQPVRIKGNASTTDAVFSRSSHHAYVNVDCKDCVTALRVNFAVASKFTVECSVNTGAFVLTPTNGIVMDIRGAGEFTAGCEFVNCIIEGVSGTGIVGTNASFCYFFGGTSEGNNKGITWGANCYLNAIFGMDLEVNTTSDIEDAGNNNQFYGLRSGSGTGSNVILTGNGATFHGGYVRQCLTTGSTLAAYYGTDFSDNGGLGIQGTGTIAGRYGCTRSNTSNVVTAKYTDLVGESGQTYTPALASSGGGTQGTTTNAVGTYNIVGKQCFFQILVVIAKGTLNGPGALSVSLPLQARNTVNDVQYVPLGQWDTVTLGANYTHAALQITPNSATASFAKSGTGVASATLNVADFADPISFRVSGSFETI